MSKAAPQREGITVVIPVRDAARTLDRFVPQWADALARLGRDYEIVCVNDGSTDATRDVLEKLAAGRVKNLTVLHHDSPRGFGACLRTALPHAKMPLFFYTSPDYPYSPQDFTRLLERISIRDAVLNKQPDLISGCRTGRATPAVFAVLGKTWRLLCRVVLGLQVDPPPVWLGVRGMLYRHFAKLIFGVPLADVNSQYKLFRTAFLCRFPIQSDSDFVHTELVAKATFLTSIMDEVPLTPVSADIPAASVWGDFWRVFRDPEFGNPIAPLPSEPGAPPPPSVTVPDATPDARGPDHPNPPVVIPT
jgi:glycosyltransferase involved in cell wall biosynthesis